jgi:hypothetical protein
MKKHEWKWIKDDNWTTSIQLNKNCIGCGTAEHIQHYRFSGKKYRHTNILYYCKTCYNATQSNKNS